ncbi:MAG: sulfotransferase family protein [Phycisphaerales bacterium]
MGIPVAEAPTVKAFRALQEQSRLIESMQVVFIVGPPKCGTTWVQTSMNGHPNAVAQGEGHMATRLLPKVRAAVEGWNAENAGQAKQSKNKTAAFLQLQEADAFVLARQAMDRVLLRYLAESKKPEGTRILAVMDKTPDHARHMGVLAHLYPWAKFVCVTRDVRDAAVSAWHHRNLLGTNQFAKIEDLAVAFAHDVWAPMLWLARRTGAALGPGRYAEISYEQYKQDPTEQAERLLRFIGLPAEPEHVSACLGAGDFARQTGGRTPGTEARSFHRKGVVGDWRAHFSEEIGDQVVEVAQRVLEMPIEAPAVQVQVREAVPARDGARVA